MDVYAQLQEVGRISLCGILESEISDKRRYGNEYEK